MIEAPRCRESSTDIGAMQLDAEFLKEQRLLEESFRRQRAADKAQDTDEGRETQQTGEAKERGVGKWRGCKARMTKRQKEGLCARRLHSYESS